VDHRARSSLNFFTAADLDRATARRQDPFYLRERLTHPATRIVPVWRSHNLLVLDEDARPVLLAPADVGGPEALEGSAILLGERNEVAYFALDLAMDESAVSSYVPARARFVQLRDVGGLLDAESGALLAYARAITYWHARHRYCGDCGRPTRMTDGGHLRVCTGDACARKHFPRTDPAIIVLVVRPGADERCLLGRQVGWPERLYSTIAGFVEPGESLEQAVVREVYEETGIAVGEVQYHSSQPWPFPSSLMLGFTATATGGGRIVRHDEELADAGWYSRSELIAALEQGRLRLPRRVSIAYRLIEDWFGGPELAAHGSATGQS